jgi:hypothetical protein
MVSIVRSRFALTRAPIMIGVLCCTQACLPTRDLGEYGPGGAASADPSGLADPSSDAGSAASSTGGFAGASGEVLPAAPPLDTTGALGNGATGGDPLGSTLEPELVDAGATALDAAASGACAAGELLGPNGHCYFMDARTTTWDLARSACQQRGAGWDLVSVRSAADSAFIADALVFEAWIGASDTAREGTWVWAVDEQAFWQGAGATGAPVEGAYANWNSTEPNGGTTTNCARALPDSFGSPVPDAPWADLPCTMALGAICEAYPVAL